MKKISWFSTSVNNNTKKPKDNSTKTMKVLFLAASKINHNNLIPGRVMKKTWVKTTFPKERPEVTGNQSTNQKDHLEDNKREKDNPIKFLWDSLLLQLNHLNRKEPLNLRNKRVRIWHTTRCRWDRRHNLTTDNQFPSIGNLQSENPKTVPKETEAGTQMTTKKRAHQLMTDPAQ